MLALTREGCHPFALDASVTQHYHCVVIPPFTADGDLPPGVHKADWKDFVARFGTTAYRMELIVGLKAALDSLKRAGCRTVYIDGSFVTAKVVPGDYDACWDETGVTIGLLDPVLRIFASKRAAQKAKFKGELFPATANAD